MKFGRFDPLGDDQALPKWQSGWPHSVLTGLVPIGYAQAGQRHDHASRAS